MTSNGWATPRRASPSATCSRATASARSSPRSRCGPRARTPPPSRSASRPLSSRPDEEAGMNFRLELVAVPVSDVDRAKAFYTEQAGFNADHDHRVSDELRFVQLTAPGSACSIAIGQGMMDTPPGSVQGLQLVVSDIEAARAALLERGVEVGEVQDFPWGRFVFFSDPDGNGWAVQQIPPRG